MNLTQQISRQFSTGDHVLLQKTKTLAEEIQCRLVLVGGVVRDLLLNRPIFDVDVMVDHPAKPFVEKLKNHLKGKLVEHSRFYTYTLHLQNNQKLDIATAREETYPKPGQLPVVTPSKIEKDLKRRDFSINAMACWVAGGEYGALLDPFDGYQDLESKKIDILHDLSFQDDPTRIFRAARFSARFGFHLSDRCTIAVERAVKEKFPQRLSAVRRRHEFERILKDENPRHALESLEKWKALSFLHPDWKIHPTHKLEYQKEENPEKRLLTQLVAWFKPFGRKKGEAMLKELEFEREKKKAILSEI